MRTASIFLAFALTATAQPIQETEAARARRLLASPQWLDKAWGAYFAGRLHAAEMEESLIEAFRESSALRDAAGYSQEHGYVTALFDAAIESGITVPAELLEPFEGNWRTQVIILLARDPAAEDSLLRLREEKLDDIQWLAVNNVLLARHSQRLFSKTLSEVEISHVFDLTDPGDNSGVGGGTGGGICGDGVLAMPKGFPPIGVYSLVDNGLPGDVLLAKGPQDVYYRRSVAPTDKQVGIGVCRGAIDRQNMRVGYLAMLTHLPQQQAENLFQPQTSIQVQNEAYLRQRWDGALSIQETAIRQFARTAQDRGLGSVSGMTLRIVPKVQDRRKSTGGPVPPLTPREFVLE